MPNSLRKRIRKLAVQNHISEEECERIIKALDKEKPMKAYITGIGHYNYNIKTKEHKTIYQGKCSSCGNGMISESVYCDKCGQAIDWSDE